MCKWGKILFRNLDSKLDRIDLNWIDEHRGLHLEDESSVEERELEKARSRGRLAASASLFEHNEMNNDDNANFECNICFDTATEPVVTLCGHLFW